MIEIIIILTAMIVIIPVACCAVNTTPEDRARDDEGYRDWLEERRKRKKVRQ